MYGRKVKLRFLFVFLILLILSLSVFLILKSLEENVIYFQSPTEVRSLVEVNKKKIRIGGMVKDKSVFFEEKELNKHTGDPFRIWDSTHPISDLRS